jgi:excisionase family DNA binding protein
MLASSTLPMRMRKEVKRTAEPWVSVDAIASHLGVARDSVYRWIERRHLPAHRIGRLWKFKVSEVDDWVRAGDANETKQDETKR